MGRYARSIKPLKPVKAAPQANADPGGDAGQRASKSRSRTTGRAANRATAGAGARRNPLPLAPFDRRLKQRVARGRDAIDARIDLHGMTQRQAHAALLSLSAAGPGG